MRWPRIAGTVRNHRSIPRRSRHRESTVGDDFMDDRRTVRAGSSRTISREIHLDAPEPYVERFRARSRSWPPTWRRR